MATRVRDLYIEEGGAVRRLQPAPSPERRPSARPRKKGKTYTKAAKKAEQSKGFDLRYTLVLATMLIMVIVSCVIMLAVQGSVESKERKIESIQQQIQDVQADNAAYENKLESMYSLDDIYTIATNELGMVYSENGAIIYYEDAQGDYVKQYDDVTKTTN